MNKITLSITASALFAAFAVVPVHAATITCNEGDDRTVTLDDEQVDGDGEVAAAENGLGAWSCGPSGDTNDQSEGQYFSSLGLPELAKIEADGYDEDDVVENDFFSITGLNGTSGRFEIFDAAIAADGLFLVFKFGAGQISPDWISFQMDGVASGTWSVNCEGQRNCQGLSHVTLVPEPGMLALFGAGLLGAGMLRRRRRAAR